MTACFAKISRISPVRSRTLMPGMRSSRLRTCEPERSSSNTTILALSSSSARLTSFTLPSPMSVAGLKFCTRCKKLRVTYAPAVSARRPSSASCSPASHGRILGVAMPTRMHRSCSFLCSTGLAPFFFGSSIFSFVINTVEIYQKIKAFFYGLKWNMVNLLKRL